MPDPAIVRAAATAAGIDFRTAYAALVQGWTPTRRSQARARFFAELERRGVKVQSIAAGPHYGETA